MATEVKVDHVGTTCRKVWTGIYALTWVLLLIGLIIWMIAVASLVPSLTDLPTNLATGFKSVFGFDIMEDDADKVKQASKDALALCNVTVVPCNPPTSTNSNLVNTKAEKDKIVAAQANSLTQLRKVTNDPYLGVSAFSESADSLNKIANATASIDDTSSCSLLVPQYCVLYDSGDAIVAGMAEVNKQIDSFTSSDMVETWKDASSSLKAMYAFPFILMIAACCFGGAWYIDGRCCRCKGIGCALTCCHVLFWIIFFILNTVIMAVSIFIKANTSEVEVPAVNGKPKLDEFMAHLEKEFPKFYEEVFKDMIDGLIGVHNSSIVMWLFSIIIVMYGCCVCCCKPYEDKENTAKVEPKGNVEVVDAVLPTS